jgi:hypothetical protein
MSRLRRFFGKLNPRKYETKSQSPDRRRAAQKISPLHPTLAIVLGSGFHHALTELRAA